MAIFRTDLRAARENLVQAHLAAEARHDIEGVLATFATPCYDLPALGGRREGADAVRELMQNLFAAFPDYRSEVVSLRHAKDAVILELRLLGTNQGDWAGIPATGCRIDLPACCIFEFDQARLSCERVYFDFHTLLQQLGVLP